MYNTISLSFFFLISILYSIRSIDVLFTRFFYLLFLIFNLHILFYINFYIWIQYKYISISQFKNIYLL